MSETLSVRIDGATKQRLDALSRQSKRSKSFLAAEAIAAYLEREERDADRIVPHEKVAGWLKSRGTAKEKKPPR
jgi:RHH-type rel operon transcriptional repressor/antitoxin RelB